jgi:hypothetical protein
MHRPPWPLPLLVVAGGELSDWTYPHASNASIAGRLGRRVRTIHHGEGERYRQRKREKSIAETEKEGEEQGLVYNQTNGQVFVALGR